MSGPDSLAFRESVQVSLAVVDGQYGYLAGVHPIEDSEGESADGNSADIVEDRGVGFGISQDSGERFLKAAFARIPARRGVIRTSRMPVRYRLWLQGGPARRRHERFRNPALTSSQVTPSSGLSR